MGTIHDESDDNYAVIGDKGVIEFVDIQDFFSSCSYNPSNESQIVNISFPFPLVNGKPQSGFVGETIFDSIIIKNTTDKPLWIWSIDIYDSKPENSFTISVMEPPSVNSDEEYIQDFMETYSLDDRVLRTDKDFSFWLSCKPKEIGLHSAAVHIKVGDENETIERFVVILAEDEASLSLSSSRTFHRVRNEFVAGRRPSECSTSCSTSSAPVRDAMINEGLTRKNYVSFFRTLLFMEERKMEEDMQAYGMEYVTMRRTKGYFLSLEVPRLPEKRPTLVNGDLIFVKLASADETAKAYKGSIHRVECHQIILRFGTQFLKIHRESNLYNVRFTYNRSHMQLLHRAVTAAKYLNSNFLFPSKVRKVEPAPFVPISCNLNEEQTRAIQMILAYKGGSPYVIHGLPGTGKTATLIETILQIYQSQIKARILVCSTSDNAADHLLERLISEGSRMIKTSIFRLNAFSRSFKDVNPDYIEFCCVENLNTCPSCRDLAKYRIVISTYTSASLLYTKGIRNGHFSHILLDDACHASEPETMVPLSHLYSNNTVVVLAGDPMQLGPEVFCKDAEISGLGTSYMERLLECELYANGNKNVMIKLIRNYRTHPAILSLTSRWFYDWGLMACKEENLDFTTSMDDLLPNTDFPLLFVGILGLEEQESSNLSWFNRYEASEVVSIIRVLIEKKGLKEENIGVITPYRQQMLKIRGALKRFHITNIKVGSVEQFWGQEKEVIIISTVHSTLKHNDFDRVCYLGLLNNPRSINVAHTRAKSLLIVIGNPHFLCKDYHWNKLLRYCVCYGCYKGCFLPEEKEFSAEFPPETEEGYNFQQSDAPSDEEETVVIPIKI